MRIFTVSIFDRHGSVGRFSRCDRTGFTLVEIMVVVVMIGMLLMIPTLNLVNVVRGRTFKAKVGELVAALDMAGAAAAESNKRYEVIIDIPEQSYLLREITNPDLSQVLDEEIIKQGYFDENCWISYVEFDDGDTTNNSRAKFRAGRGGWQYGGKIVLLDEDERPYSIVINRINRTVSLVEGDAILLKPKAIDDVPF